jgi:murein DD-endopeptidase MepM/ murein hydrolase activator NlpD
MISRFKTVILTSFGSNNLLKRILVPRFHGDWLGPRLREDDAGVVMPTLLLLILLSSCAKQDPSNASIVLNPVDIGRERNLATVVVHTSKGQQRIKSSVWNASAHKFGVLPPVTIKARAGDTVYTISRRHMVPLRTLIDRNHLKAPFALTPGQQLIVDRPRVHVVGRGESLGFIAQLHGVDTYALAQMNDLTAPFSLVTGQPLVLPSRLTDLKLPPPRLMIAAEPIKAVPSGTVVKIKSAKPPKAFHAQESRSGFRVPVEGKIIQDFGRQSGGIQNDGVNIAAPMGTPVKSADHGVVAYVGRDIPSFGKLVLVKHQDGWISAYAHVDKVAVQRGQQIRKGETIARVGKTGSVSQPQLHFELRRGRKPVDPKKYIGF